MIDVMFMDWVKMSLTLAFQRMFDESKEEMILLIMPDSAAYHHGYSDEVKVPESASKTYNESLLQKHVERINPESPKEGRQDSTAIFTAYNFKIAVVGQGDFHHARSASSNDGVS